MRTDTLIASSLTLLVALGCNSANGDAEEPTSGDKKSAGEETEQAEKKTEEAEEKTEEALPEEMKNSEEAPAVDELLGSDTPESYEFPSRFAEGSSVSYSGQSFRHLLIADLSSYIKGLDEAVETGISTADDAVLKNLLAYYDFDSEATGDLTPLLTVSGMDIFQTTYDDVSSGKNLSGKIAGKDGKEYKDFNTVLAGWADETLAANGGSTTSADGLVQAIFATLNANAISLELNGPTRTLDDGTGGDIALKVHYSDNGVDLQQLVQKFILGAVAFNQGADDYLDEGLESDNVEAKDGTAAYTALEHAWDEGFGYFGASRGYSMQTDDQVADGEVLDIDEDGKVDLTSEYNFGASVNAAKRDRGSTSGTDLSGQAMNAFLRGRAIISSAGGALSEEQMSELKDARDEAVDAWEKALAATAIHYVNDTLGDMAKLGTADYDFATHSKHWSELKGFALSLQFSPFSPLVEKDFAELHALLGDAPVFGKDGEAALTAYETALMDARKLLGDAYTFAEVDVANW